MSKQVTVEITSTNRMTCGHEHQSSKAYRFLFFWGGVGGGRCIRG